MSENQPSNENQVPLENTPPAVESSMPVPVPVPVAPVETTLPPAPAPKASTGRPIGVTVIAIVAFISGLMGLCAPMAIGGVSTIGLVIPSGFTQVLGGLGLIFTCILGFGPFLQIIFAYGAWNLRSWAWWLGIISLGISVLGVIVGIVSSGGASILTTITNALLPIIIFVYLLMPNTRKAFDR